MTRRLLLLGFLVSGFVTARTIPGRYIIQLDDEAQARSRLRARLEQRKLKIRGGVQRVANALFVEAATADELRAMPGVKRVTPVREYHLLMDRAVVLHRVTEVWNRVGAERAGEGMKIAILDTGVDAKHAALRDDSLPVLSGYPRATRTADLENTSPKVIVARSYVNLLQRADPDLSAVDHIGHGTAVAAVAAGVRAVGPLATIRGVAPGARIGNYKIFGSPNVNEGTNDEAILTAIEDAVNDGMDVINLSLGTDFTPRLEDDPVALALERAARGGVIVVAAAGNSGTAFSTLGSPATAPSVIAVGSTTSDRVFGAGVEWPGHLPLAARAGDKFGQTAPIAAPLGDVLPLDGAGTACGALRAGSLTGRIALVERGACTFEAKLNNVQAAGAVAALIYALADAPEPITMSTGPATLPGAMISNADGLALRAQLAQEAGVMPRIRFTPGPLESVPFRLSSFSSSGPGVDLAVKPEVVATGSDLYVATQSGDAQGAMFDDTGFIQVDGTSFSSPMVAGVAALVKAARPGLSIDAYRSLIINTARPLAGTVQQFGAGALDAAHAVDSTLTAAPAALSFGTSPVAKQIMVASLDGEGETVSIEVAPSTAGGPAPVAPASVRVEPGAAAQVNLEWTASTLPAGVYEGTVIITGTRTGQTIRVPYWLASPTNTPAAVRLMDQTASGRPGANLRQAIYFRVMESTGIVLDRIEPQVTVTRGGGSVARVLSANSEIPGLFVVDVRLGAAAGANVFQIKAGEVTVDVTITGR